MIKRKNYLIFLVFIFIFSDSLCEFPGINLPGTLHDSSLSHSDCEIIVWQDRMILKPGTAKAQLSSKTVQILDGVGEQVAALVPGPAGIRHAWTKSIDVDAACCRSRTGRVPVPQTWSTTGGDRRIEGPDLLQIPGEAARLEVAAGALQVGDAKAVVPGHPVAAARTQAATANPRGKESKSRPAR